MGFLINTTAKVKASPVASIAGGLAGFYLAKKMMKEKKNMYVLIGATLAGVILAATVASNYKTKDSNKAITDAAKS
jgi:orotate phosphoribosyltransferase